MIGLLYAYEFTGGSLPHNAIQQEQSVLLLIAFQLVRYCLLIVFGWRIDSKLTNKEEEQDCMTFWGRKPWLVSLIVVALTL